MEKYTPNGAQEIHKFSTKRIIALQSVNKIFLERYDFAAILQYTYWWMRWPQGGMWAGILDVWRFSRHTGQLEWEDFSIHYIKNKMCLWNTNAPREWKIPLTAMPTLKLLKNRSNAKFPLSNHLFITVVTLIAMERNQVLVHKIEKLSLKLVFNM
jgi:hypothetical protein